MGADLVCGLPFKCESYVRHIKPAPKNVCYESTKQCKQKSYCYQNYCVKLS